MTGNALPNGAVFSNTELIELVRKGVLVIDPFDPRFVRGASVCLRLGSQFMSPEFTGEVNVRVQESYPTCPITEVDPESGISIPSKTLVLANTLERVALSRGIIGWISNLSGLARLGLQVVLSNLVSPGYGEHGPTTLTLELFNALDVSIRVYPGMRICHLILLRLQQAATISYDTQVGTYAGQSGPRASQFYSDFHKD